MSNRMILNVQTKKLIRRERFNLILTTLGALNVLVSILNNSCYYLLPKVK